MEMLTKYKIVIEMLTKYKIVIEMLTKYKIVNHIHIKMYGNAFKV